MSLSFRKMVDEDVNAVTVLAGEIDAYPWSEGQYASCLNYSYETWVIELEGELVGFVVLVVHDEECEIANIGVAKAKQHQGIGKKIIFQVFEYSREHQLHKVWLEVRASNLPAIQFYKKMGFIQKGVRKAYYRTKDGREDALVYVKELT